MLQLYPKPRKKSVMPTDYRSKILTAAIKVFAQKGYANTTMSDVAIHAKVGIGTLYNYFKNKDDLLLQSMRKTIEDEIYQIQVDSESIKDPIDKLHNFFIKHGELVVSKPYIAKFLVIELRQSEGFYKRNPSYNPMQYYFEYVKKIFQEAIAIGRIRDVNLDVLSYMVIGYMDVIFTQWLISGKTLEIEPYINSIREILSQGVSLAK